MIVMWLFCSLPSFSCSPFFSPPFSFSFRRTSPSDCDLLLIPQHRGCDFTRASVKKQTMGNPKAKRPVRRITTDYGNDSDDVSALSMAGASVLAAKVYASLSPPPNVTVGNDIIHEDHDAEHDVGEAVEQEWPPLDNEFTSRLKNLSDRRRPPLSPDKLRASAVDSLFPDLETEQQAVTFDEWQKSKKKKEKKKHKHKKHSKKVRSNEFIEVIQYDMSMPLSLHEIYLPTDDSLSAKDSFKDSVAQTHLPSLGKTIPSNPSVASTAESTGSRYQRRDSLQTAHTWSGVPLGATVVNTFLSELNDLPDILRETSLRSSLRSYRSNPDFLRSSLRSALSNESVGHKSHVSGNESLAHISCLSVHSATYSFASFCSRVSVEDIQKVKIELEQAKEEEIKVLELYTKIEKEVNSLVERISDFEEKRSNVESESEAASEERQGLQSFLNKILDDNAKLNAKLQSMEDEEDEKRMDDVLEGMQAKMRALRLKRNKKGTGQK
jgi:hypothetical protein